MALCSLFAQENWAESTGFDEDGLWLTEQPEFLPVDDAFQFSFETGGDGASRASSHAGSVSIPATPKSLRAYCLLFIYIFPFIYVPGILGDTNVSDMQHNVLIYVLCILISFVLVALYNIQDFIENPFDNEGLDDIKMDDYFMDKKEL